MLHVVWWCNVTAVTCHSCQLSVTHVTLPSCSVGERVMPRLSHANAAVVLSAVKVLMKMTEHIPPDSPFLGTLNKKLAPPLGEGRGGEGRGWTRRGEGGGKAGEGREEGKHRGGIQTILSLDYGVHCWGSPLGPRVCKETHQE